ncbi:MAG: malto-oligosyltrehalose synthase [Xanthobacteraceae bacterium]
MRPIIPLATYRLQLTPAFGFDDAAAAIPYLKRLGITHLYASPILKARAGSTHGYDVVDHQALNPELGDEAAFDRLCGALELAHMGLLLDFVPNHMGVLYADNPWWLDVLEWGPRSPYAASFDIDWKPLPGHPRVAVLIPILGSSYGAALEGGEIEFRYDPDEGSFSAWYYEHRLPIGPSRYREILHKVVAEAGAQETAAGRALLTLAERERGPHNPPRSRAAAFKAALAEIDGGAEVIEQGLRAYRPKSGAPGAALALHYVLEHQHYRLAHWRLAGSEINYRRFFDINSLAGLRIEDRPTFDAVHARMRSMIAQGRLSGLRLDHIDGLHDPHQYFRRLQGLIEKRQGTAAHGFYVIVEKILADRERLPRFAGVAGTTGYEWLNVITRVLLDERGLGVLDALWKEVSGDRRSFEEIHIEAKRRVIANILASEFTVLTRMLARIAAGHYTTRDYSDERLRQAFELFILHFPIYRTYLTPSGPSREDRAIIEMAIGKARAGWFGADADIFDFLRDVLTLDLIAPGRVGYSSARTCRFAFKVQQFTGPMMAKSLEDTAFYRYHRLLALNEVGGDPAAGAISVSDFHERMNERATRLPHGLTATATHDTKRGEDARARLIGLSELAEEWTQNIRDWRKLNAHLVVHDGRSRMPSAAHEYMLYQALLGAWPLEIDAAFAERMVAYAIKAAREGKEQTSWLAPSEAYENGLKQYVLALLDTGRSQTFLDRFGSFARRAALLGALTSLSQLTLKMTMPGIPDFYQGTELWDLALVDPDNRRPVDFTQRASMLTALSEPVDWQGLAADWPDGRIKLALTRRLLALRAELPELFTEGSYRAVEVSGPHRNEIMAFARVSGREAVIVAVGRLFARTTNQGRRWPSAQSLDASLAPTSYTDIRNLLTGAAVNEGHQLAVNQLFEFLPVALLRAQTARTRGRRATPGESVMLDELPAEA